MTIIYRTRVERKIGTRYCSDGERGRGYTRNNTVAPAAESSDDHTTTGPIYNIIYVASKRSRDCNDRPDADYHNHSSLWL